MRPCGICKKNPIRDEEHAWLCEECEIKMRDGVEPHFDEGQTEVKSGELANRFIYRVSLPDSVTTVRSNAFGQFIEEVVFPDSVTTLQGRSMFKNSPLRRVRLGSGVKSIDYEMFMGCSVLSDVTLSEGLKEIGSNAFYATKALTRVAFPRSLSTVSSSAFARSGLCELTLGDRILYIGAWAFHNCPALEQVTLTGGASTVISDEAFAENPSLVRVRLGSGVRSIGKRVFYLCGALKEVYLPSSLEELGEQIFYGCDGLTVYYEGSAAEWRRLSKPRVVTVHNMVRGQWDKYPYYNSDGTHYEESEHTVRFELGAKDLTVICLKDGKKISYNNG